MDTQKLITMANQIGQFFEAMPDRPQALEDIARHVGNFWEPRMRAQLLAHLDQSQGAGLSVIVHEAFTMHRGFLE